MGGVRNGAAEEDWCWDLNPGVAATVDGWDHVALGYSLLPCDLGSRKDFTWKKKGEKTLAGEPWEGPSHMALD